MKKEEKYSKTDYLQNIQIRRHIYIFNHQKY